MVEAAAVILLSESEVAFESGISLVIVVIIVRSTSTSISLDVFTASLDRSSRLYGEVVRDNGITFLAPFLPVPTGPEPAGMISRYRLPSTVRRRTPAVV